MQDLFRESKQSPALMELYAVEYLVLPCFLGLFVGTLCQTVLCFQDIGTRDCIWHLGEIMLRVHLATHVVAASKPEHLAVLRKGIEQFNLEEGGGGNHKLTKIILTEGDILTKSVDEDADSESADGAPRKRLRSEKADPLPGIDVLVSKAKPNSLSADLEACGLTLKVVLVPYAGPPKSLHETLRSSAAHQKVRVVNAHHNAAPTAEYAITMMMAASKRLFNAHEKLRVGDWTPRGIPPDPGAPAHPMPQQTLQGLKVCILGFGAIGKRVRVCSSVVRYW